MDIRLTHHHGLGNEFLVVDTRQVVEGVSLERMSIDWVSAAIAWCNSNGGRGADGLLLLDGSGPDMTMRLINADGSPAEMSGNGIRCLVQAGFMAESSEFPVVNVVTDAGLRIVHLVESLDDHSLMLSVSMGLVSPLDEPEHWERLECNPDRPVRHLSLGNPHSVVGVDDIDAVDLCDLGERVPHINLEIVSPGPEPDAITMRVHERGVGLTQACGTGACAAAEAALTWGLVAQSADAVTVHMPGGDAVVHINRDTTEATLTGPAVFTGEVMVTL
ncbi:MAG: diaminopimelate epimerase [Acidimicrobiaceae bacterium]|nr:diaminopimelate epimerase [Acidimicrobiaceae bacterium]